MRLSRSPSGSFMDIVRASLPARLQQTGNEPFRAELAQRDARQLVLAIEAARPPGHLAAIADAAGRRIARQFGELERRRETILDRLGLVLGDRLQPRATAGELLRQASAPVVLLDR